jgi:hypothetical protein
MKPAELLAELGRLAVVIDADSNGRPVLDGMLSDELIAAARVHRWLFTWGLWGALSGHFWFVCDACSEVQLLSHERSCGMKPGCKGRMHRAPAPAFMPSEVPAVVTS